MLVGSYTLNSIVYKPELVLPEVKLSEMLARMGMLLTYNSITLVVNVEFRDSKSLTCFW